LKNYLNKKAIIMKKIIILLAIIFPVIAYAGNDAQEFTVEGIKVILKPSPKEVITAKLFVRGGTSNYSKEQEGIESFALQLAMSGGTTTMDKLQFANESEKIGAGIGAGSGMDFGSFDLVCVKMFWDKSWNLFADAIVNPAFAADEYEIIKEQLISGAKQNEADPDAHLRLISLQGAFAGKNYAKSPNGTSASLPNITLDQIKAYYKKTVGKQRIFLVVVGNVTKEDLTAKIKASLSKLPAGTPALVEPKNSLKTPSVLQEDRKMATNYVRGMMDAPKVNTPEGVAMAVAMDIVRDRMFIELRTKRSLTYAPGAGYASQLAGSPYSTLYVSSVDPKKSIEVMVEEVDKIRTDGFSEKELKDKKLSFLTDYYMGLETTESIAGQIGTSEVQGNWRQMETFTQAVQNLTVEQINAAFKKYSNTIKWTYLGDNTLVKTEDFKQPKKASKAKKISTTKK
jgi:zinc protease